MQGQPEHRIHVFYVGLLLRLVWKLQPVQHAKKRRRRRSLDLISRFITTLRSLKAANILLPLPSPQQTLCEMSGAERLQRSVTSPGSPSSCIRRSGEANPVHQIMSPLLLTTTPHWLSGREGTGGKMVTLICPVITLQDPLSFYHCSGLIHCGWVGGGDGLRLTTLGVALL
uniref:Uncharacterized protein n=1 Tax=Podarcis muralis TaxID=64176 RepID=A0A670K985_PODMU